MSERLGAIHRIGAAPYTVSAALVAMLVLSPLTLLYAALDIVWTVLFTRDFPVGSGLPKMWKNVSTWTADNLYYAYSGNGSFRWTASM